MPRWTQERDVPRLRYGRKRDLKNRGWHYLWEGFGFGAQVFKTGRAKWMQCGSSKNPATGKWKSYFHSIGDVSSIKLADARAEGQRRKRSVQQPPACVSTR